MESSAPVSAPRIGREGSRWFNKRPTAAEFSEWCKNSIPTHDGLEIERYIPGITLISQGEKENAIIGWSGPKPKKEEIWHEVYTPYPKVETRVLYWQDWIAKGDGDTDYFGVIQPVKPPEADKRLPAGFFSASFDSTAFVCCTMEAIVYNKKTVRREKITIDKRTGEQQFVFVGDELFRFTPATKQVPVMRGTRNGSVPDENALMKAETGAIGRALGLAGMLMVPGAGIASAEDIQELSAAPVQPTLPIQVADSRPAEMQIEDLRKRAQELINGLDNQQLAEFQEWARQRGLADFNEADFATLKTAVKKMEQMTS